MIASDSPINRYTLALASNPALIDYNRRADEKLRAESRAAEQFRNLVEQDERDEKTRIADANERETGTQTVPSPPDQIASQDQASREQMGEMRCIPVDAQG